MKDFLLTLLYRVEVVINKILELICIVIMTAFAGSFVIGGLLIIFSPIIVIVLGLLIVFKVLGV